ncbi:MAG: hypothetical protein ACYC27_15630 [Armatimonadota bacterium]
MYDLSYKPELESVESSGGLKPNRKMQLGILIINIIALLFLLVAVYFMFTEVSINIILVFSVVIIAAITAIFIWLRNILNADFYLKIDNDGIHSQSLRESKFICWDDVTDINVSGSLYETIYTIKSGESSIKATDGNFYLMASVWQHLKKRDKSEKIKLSEESLSLWKMVPDNIPEEIEWINPHQPNYKQRIVLVITVFILVFVPTIIYMLVRGGFIHLLTFSPWIFIAILVVNNSFIQSTLITARCATLNGNFIHVEVYKKSLDIQLSQVKRAFWYNMDLRIVDQNDNLVSIPFLYNSIQSVQLFLAIIRLLRETNPQVFISLPNSLLLSAKGVRQGSDSGQCDE